MDCPRMPVPGEQMRVLLDTNIIIHREASTVIDPDIGILFKWLDDLRYQKCIHPITIDEITKHGDPKTVATFKIKLSNYQILKTVAPTEFKSIS